MNIALIAAAVLSPLGQGTPVNVSADIRSYPELASALNGPGHHITVAPELANRLVVVSLRNRPWEEARSILEQGLGISLRQTSEGEYTLEENPEIATRKLKMYNAFLIEAEAGYAEIFKEYRRLSRNQIPPRKEMIKALIDEQVRMAPPGPGSGEGPILYRCSAPWKTLAALGLLFGTASSEGDHKVSGPALYYAMKGTSIKRMIGGDIVNTGNAYFWRDWRDLPEWVRTRAVANVRNKETQLASQDIPLADKERQLDETARATNITHRLHFDPVTGNVSFEYSVLTDPSSANQIALILEFSLIDSINTVEEQRKEVAITALKVKADLDSAWLNFEGDIQYYGGAAGSWYDDSPIRGLAVPLNPDLIKRASASAELADTLPDRINETTAILADPILTRAFDSHAGSLSLAEALSGFANQTGTEVVAEIPPVRDTRLATSSSKIRLVDIAPWMANIKQDRQRQIPAWTLSRNKGVLVVRDEWAFMDDKYTVPLSAALWLGRRAIDLGVGNDRGLKYDDLAEYAKTVTSPVNVELTRVDPAFGVPGAARVAPFINFLEKLPLGLKQGIFQKLKQDGNYTIEMRSIGLQPKLVLMNELRKISEADSRANVIGSVLHHSIFYPFINDSVTNGNFVMNMYDLKIPGRKLYRIEFTLFTPTTWVNKGNSKPMPQAGAGFYQEEFGPIEIP